MAFSVSPSGNRPIAGIFWMVLAGLNFIAVSAIVKFLGQGIPAAQSAFLRYAWGLVFVIPMLRPMLASVPNKQQIGLFWLRGAIHSIGVTCWFYAMTKITIAEVTALNYVSPVYVSLGAVLFLDERFAWRRIAAVVAALIGALIILRPGFRELSSGHLAMLVTAFAFSGGYLIAKKLSDSFSAAVIVGWMSITVTIGLTPFAIAVWVPLNLVQYFGLFMVAAFATAGHYTMILAFRCAPVSITQPVVFLQLVWAVMLGILVFSEPVDSWVVVGGAIIVGAVSFISWREAKIRRKSITPPHTATKV